MSGNWNFNGYCNRLKNPKDFIIKHLYYLSEKLDGILILNENFGCWNWKEKKK